MPEVTEDERGRRIFQIHRELAVETAIEKIRQNIGQDWKLYSASDIDIMKFILGECWIFMARQRWGRCTFTRLSKDDLDSLIKIGKELKRDERLEGDAVREAIEILNRVS
jgi:hypothetical protein